VATLAVACLADGPATAQVSTGASAMVESEALAARFPDPAVSYRTPAFEPGHDGFTSNAELRVLLRGLASDPANVAIVKLLEIGSSQTGVPLEALQFSRPASSASHPTVLLIGQQHGDEPVGSEALLAVAQELGHGSLTPLLDRIDVIVMPRANPDGAKLRRRGTASGIDVNRDHLLLRTPEAQALATLERDFNPVVVVDAHEFAALAGYVDKFGAAQRFDALLQYATVANLPGLVTRASEEWFRQPLQHALNRQGLSSDWYHITSADPNDKQVSMGGVLPDTGRNVNGLRNAVSFLIETRGADLGRAHLLRRVHTQVSAVTSILESAAARADDLRRLRRFVDAEVAAKACQGDMVVLAAPTPSEYTLAMLDPQTGADKSINVAWSSSLALTTVTKRPRPCGYWLGAGETDAVLRLRGLGLRVQRIDEAGELRGESYVEATRSTEPGATAGIAEGGEALRVKVALAPALIDGAAGSFYVGLDQPLANLAIAALEPDTPASFFANRIIESLNAQARVLRRPELKMSTLP
jgi:hypothetical protein